MISTSSECTLLSSPSSQVHSKSRQMKTSTSLRGFGALGAGLVGLAGGSSSGAGRRRRLYQATSASRVAGTASRPSAPPMAAIEGLDTGRHHHHHVLYERYLSYKSRQICVSMAYRCLYRSMILVYLASI